MRPVEPLNEHKHFFYEDKTILTAISKTSKYQEEAEFKERLNGSLRMKYLKIIPTIQV